MSQEGRIVIGVTLTMNLASTSSANTSTNSSTSGSPSAFGFVEQKVIQRLKQNGVLDNPEDRIDENRIKTEDSDDEYDDDEMMNLAIITSKERKKERNLRKELEYRKMEATKDLDMMLLKHKENVRDLGRRHEYERREMEKALRRKQVEELDEMNLANEQERLAIMKKSHNGINTINAQLNWSRLSLEKVSKQMYKSMRRKFMEEEEDDLVPECPVCMVDMLPPKQIFQCLEGHLVCSDCRPRANAFGCATCRHKNGYQSRARYIEDLVRKRIKSY